MITQLQVENFKSWKTTGKVALAPLTGLFGPNNSGKTSLLQILPLLKQTAELSDRSRVLYTGREDSPVYVGPLRDIIHGRQRDAALTFSISWNLPEPLKIPNPSDQNMLLYNIHQLWFTTSIRWQLHRPMVERFEYKFEEHCFGMTRSGAANDRDNATYRL